MSSTSDRIPVLGTEDLEWYTTATTADTDDPGCPTVLRAMATEILALRAFLDRYRKTWQGAHGCYRRHQGGSQGCLVCEADQFLGGRTE